MKRGLAMTVTAAVATVLVTASAWAQPTGDHLLIYKVRATPKTPVDYSMDLRAAVPQLSALGRTLKAGSRAKHLLVPVDKSNVTPVPPDPTIGGENIGTEYLCYKVECPRTVTDIQLERTNQFLAHAVRKARVRRVCVPSQVSTPPTTVPGCREQDESCAGGETCCEGLVCCAGLPVPPGQEFCGAICPISDRERKESFARVDASDVLDKLAGLEITSWSYKAEGDDVRHLGPMAQDFRAAFGLGSTDEAIFLVDADGVALTAIQALNRELDSLREENTSLRRSLESVEARLAEMERR